MADPRRHINPMRNAGLARPGSARGAMRPCWNIGCRWTLRLTEI